VSEHLDKAKKALEQAKIVHAELVERSEGSGDDSVKSLIVDYSELMEAARTQAALAQADALERMAFLQECSVGLRQVTERYKPKVAAHDPSRGYV
jgi:arginine utilization protein RocB